MADNQEKPKKKSKKTKSSGDADLLMRLRRRYSGMASFDRENRINGMSDLRFVVVPGEQWDPMTVRERGSRPRYEYNKLRISGKRVINDMRDNRPSVKIRAVENGDKGTADIYEGLFRNIWNISDGDTIVDYAGQYQVYAGMGAWRVCTDYVSADSFDQDIYIEAIPNPFCLYWDNAAKDPLKRDARDWIVTERISRDEFEEKYPDREVIEFDGAEFDDNQDWFGDSEEATVRICEYWYKVPVQNRLLLTADGMVVDANSEDGQALLANIANGTLPQDIIKKERISNSHDIRMCVASGDAILEKREWAGKEFPFVVVFGEHIIVDGKHVWGGLTRYGKDAQRSYNAARTSVTETIALAPNFKWWATPKQAEGLTDQWAEAHRKLFPYMLYNADALAGAGPPQMMQGAQLPAALVQECVMASDEIKSVTGIFDASLGAQSNEQSGVAIARRKQQGEIATFNFRDNMTKGVRRTAEIIIDLIPKVYDTERQLRILGADGSETYKKVNTFVIGEDGISMVRVNDLSVGKYDVAVTSGPSFATQRQEAAEMYGQMGQQNPQIWGVAGDLMMKAMDLPYAQEIAERIQMLLPDPIKQMIQSESEIPPQVAMMMQQMQGVMQQVQQQSELVQAAAAEVDQKQADLEKTAAQVDAKKAQLEAFFAKEQANLKGVQMHMMSEEMARGEQEKAEVEKAGGDKNKQLGVKLETAIDGIQQMAEQFTAMAMQAVEAMRMAAEAKNMPLPGAQRASRRIARTRRMNGEMITEIVDVPEETQAAS